MLLEYIIKFHLQDCLTILGEEDKLGYYSIKIDFLKLFETHPAVGDKILCEPIQSLPECDKEIIKAQHYILEQEEHQNNVSRLDYHCLKRNVHARFFGLPVCPELHRTIFPKNVDLGCFLKVAGTVVRVTQSKMLEYQRKYVCMKCKFENLIEAEFENRYILKAPSKCTNTDIRCRCSTFTQVHLVSREHCKDYQEIKIQEQVNKLSIGTIPGSMWVVLEDDLVDSCKPGDDVIICATVRRRWRPLGQNRKSEVDLLLQANYLEVCNAQRSQVITKAPDIKDCFDGYWVKYEACPLKGRDQILKAVSPQVYGLQLVKLAVLLTAITGSNHIVEDSDKRTNQEDKYSTRVRGQCHLLLVGDPGTGKSQLLRAGAELTTRCVFTSGAGSTRAGLTCAALREDGEWQLEAGALVLSDGGVCCIDEISQLREHDRTAIHEAMEQQTISVAKAGIVCKLNTRCAIIAACNPKGHYDTDQPLSMNVSLGTPLLSRFDLIFILLDSKNKAWDKLVSSYILFGGSEKEKLWTIEKLQMYISLVGPRKTVMTKSANVILQSYYMKQRKSQLRDPSRTTVRMLDSLVRLSQAHCRLMYRTTILPMDAIVAVSLVDLSMQDCTLSDTVDALHSTFQKYPDYDYLCTAKKLLSSLNLGEIWQNELLYYAKLLQVDYKTLENDLENGVDRLFAKYDDVSVDNIPLSLTVITSSYFNDKKGKQKSDLIDNDNDQGEHSKTEKGTVLNEKLAKTLKKHANLNREDKQPVNNVTRKKKPYKRKRKVVSVDISTIGKKISTKANEANELKIDDDYEERINLTENNDFEGLDNILDSDIPLNHENLTKYGVRCKKDEYICKKNNSSINTPKASTSYDDNIDRGNKSNGNNENILTESRNRTSLEDITKLNNENIKPRDSTKVVDKLKQFQFVERHDLSKYEEKITKPNEVVNNVIKLEKSLNEIRSSSSQISIFESEDYDMDLDI